MRHLLVLRIPATASFCMSSRHPEVTSLRHARLVDWEPWWWAGVMTVWYLTSIWLFSLVFGAEGKELPVVNIPDQGPVSGKEVPVSRSQKAIVYLGIPFAHPPKNRRLLPPKTDPLPSWTEVKNATSFAPACLQNKEALREHHSFLSDILADQIETLEFKEDCLYLNIFVPDGKRRNWQISHMTYSCTLFTYYSFKINLCAFVPSCVYLVLS